VLRATLEKTQAASKMKGEFLANMSHEIRTPMNAIIGMTYLSLRDKEITVKQRGYLDKIQAAAKSLLGILNDILDLSKVEAGKLKLETINFNLHETIENTLSMHQTNASNKGLDLSMEYAEDTPRYFFGDPLRIGQILNNLISNAVKFTKEGVIYVSCQKKTDEQAPDGCTVLLVCVKDTGIGMSESALKTIFQPFTQADASITRKFGGTGLGLAISERLVQLLNGKFEVTSEVGKGTTFSFTMCLPEDASGEQAKNEEVSLTDAFAELGLAGKRILVAEDNDINQLIISELMEPSEATLVMANNGEEAVAAVKDADYDLVLMDMQMPIMDGLEATRLIRTFKDAQTLPIIAVTANAMREDKDKGLAIGMNGYITKPIEPAELLAALRLYLK
jgi:CheY-like chemotaxis protein/two-component sensor histidine kinase